MHRFPALPDAMDYGRLYYERQVYRTMLPESI